MSKVITLIGYTGQGKTLTTKQLIGTNSAYIFDVNNEYSDIGTCENSLNKDVFLNNSAMLKNTFIIFEDATGFFSGKAEQGLKKLLQNKRHTNNTYIFLFHSVQDTPPFFFRMSNYIILFKTLDRVQDVETKAHYILPYFEALQKLPLTNYPNITKKIIKIA